MQVVLFEDGQHRAFGPLTSLRPMFSLRCGVFRLREKWEMRRPRWRVALLPRAELADVFAEELPRRGIDGLGDGPTVLVSGRALADERLLAAAEAVSGEAVLRAGNAAVGARIERDVRGRVGAFGRSGGDVAVLGIDAAVDVPARLVSRPWDIVELTAGEIAADAELRGVLCGVKGLVHPGAHLIEPGRVAIGEGATVGPGAVIDAAAGPVVIGEGATVMANAVVIGPAAVGARSVVRAGARIYGGTSIGPVCKVGGEVEASVLQSFTNKQHDGFLGHSYLGSWVNIGAATDGSDLKNNYGDVRVEIGGELVDTGLTHVGAVVGDHSKTAIGTKLGTGTVVGAFCSVLSSGPTPRSIPAFSWGTGGGFVLHDVDRALATARRVMARRGMTLTAAYEARVRALFREARPDAAQ